MKKLIILVAMCTGGYAMAQNNASTANSGAGTPGRMGSETEQFIRRAAMMGQMEIKAGEMARTRASNPQVRSFGEMMVRDHTRSSSELQAIARRKNITLPMDHSNTGSANSGYMGTGGQGNYQGNMSSGSSNRSRTSRGTANMRLSRAQTTPSRKYYNGTPTYWTDKDVNTNAGSTTSGWNNTGSSSSSSMGTSGQNRTTGNTGTNGTMSTTGTMGATGTMGTNGTTGTNGTMGATGTTGTMGTNGTMGTTGTTGTMGTTGNTGMNGTMGTGTTGTNGTMGTTGTTGTNGTMGTTGTTGTTSNNGTMGTTGTTGTNGTTGTMGTTGTTGTTSNTGISGTTGTSGNTGTTGTMGTTGTTGNTGTTGTMGTMGTTGTTGSMGTMSMTGMQDDHQAKLNMLSQKTGAEFDRAYMDMMVTDHSTAIQLYEQALRSTDSDVSAYATKTLPILRQHHEQATTIRSRVSTSGL